MAQDSKTAPQAELEPILFTEKVAHRWGCTPATVIRKYRQLGLKPIRIGKRLGFYPSDLIRAEKRQRGELV